MLELASIQELPTTAHVSIFFWEKSWGEKDPGLRVCARVSVCVSLCVSVCVSVCVFVGVSVCVSDMRLVRVGSSFCSSWEKQFLRSQCPSTFTMWSVIVDTLLETFFCRNPEKSVSEYVYWKVTIIVLFEKMYLNTHTHMNTHTYVYAYTLIHSPTHSHTHTIHIYTQELVPEQD